MSKKKKSLGNVVCEPSKYTKKIDALVDMSPNAAVNCGGSIEVEVKYGYNTSKLQYRSIYSMYT